MALLEDFLASLCLILGIVLGESIASKAFGRPIKKSLFLVELVIFVAIIMLVSRTIYLMEFDLIILLLINGFIGVISAIASRGVSTGLGIIAKITEERGLSRYTREERLVINTIELLSKQGVKKEEIKQMLYDAGFSKKMVEHIFKTHKFKTYLNPLVKRIAELEEEIERLKKRS